MQSRRCPTSRLSEFQRVFSAAVDDASSKPPCYRDDASEVVKTLRTSGHVAYFAGGCVRDLLMGHEPKDYDVATDAHPQKVRSLFKNTQAVGAAFGVILVRFGRSVVEVATFRSEGKYLDGRRPSEVHFTTAEEDAKRRDFTINGLFLDPATNDVIDYVGGRTDLTALLVRAIGVPDERFEEDHLRLLRAIRFAARFGFEIEPVTAAAISRHAHHLIRISPERIADELRQMLSSTTRVRAAELLEQFKLLPIIWRFMRQPPRIDLGVFARVAPNKPISFGLALAALVASGGDEAVFSKAAIHSATSALRQSLRLSNDELETFAGTLEGIALLNTNLSLAGKKRFLARATAASSRELWKAISPDSLPHEAELRELEKSDFAPPPLLTGDDLTAAGWKPGPAFKKVLDAVYDAQLEGKIATKDEALRFAAESRPA